MRPRWRLRRRQRMSAGVGVRLECCCKRSPCKRLSVQRGGESQVVGSCKVHSCTPAQCSLLGPGSVMTVSGPPFRYFTNLLTIFARHVMYSYYTAVNAILQYKPDLPVPNSLLEKMGGSSADRHIHRSFELDGHEIFQHRPEDYAPLQLLKRDIMSILPVGSLAHISRRGQTHSAAHIRGHTYTHTDTHTDTHTHRHTHTQTHTHTHTHTHRG